MEVMNLCNTQRRVKDPDAPLREVRDKGCVIWLMLDPLCHQDALARLYELEPDAEKTILLQVHQTDDLDYIPILPRGKGGRP